MSTLHDKLAAIEQVFANWLSLADAEKALRDAVSAYNAHATDIIASQEQRIVDHEARLADIEGLLAKIADHPAISIPAIDKLPNPTSDPVKVVPLGADPTLIPGAVVGGVLGHQTESTNAGDAPAAATSTNEAASPADTQPASPATSDPAPA